MTKIELHNDLSLYPNNEYYLTADGLNNPDIKHLRFRTGSFETSKIMGKLTNFNLDLNICSMEFIGFEFDNCNFNQESWFDSSTFTNCIFNNCTIQAHFRWCEFTNCTFINTTIDSKYIRNTTIRKSCNASNFKIITEQLDESSWFLGKRFKQNYYNDGKKCLVEIK